MILVLIKLAGSCPQSKKEGKLLSAEFSLLVDTDSAMTVNTPLLPSLLMKRWINYVMFNSLWLIADNDV